MPHLCNRTPTSKNSMPFAGRATSVSSSCLCGDCPAYEINACGTKTLPDGSRPGQGTQLAGLEAYCEVWQRYYNEGPLPRGGRADWGKRRAKGNVAATLEVEREVRG
eukprot:jgi/Botrbrau1/10343/Bobra.0321s0018.1